MIDEHTIISAKELVKNLESGNEKEAQLNLDSLSSISENNLFKEVGRLTRELHDTLTNFHLDNRLTSLAAQDIPDAKDRLEYVLTSTADAANKTMDAVEKGISITDTIKDEAGTLNLGWKKIEIMSLKVRRLTIYVLKQNYSFLQLPKVQLNYMIYYIRH